MSDVSPSRRTVSSLGTDFESEAYGLIVLINRMNRIPLMKSLLENVSNSILALTSLRPHTNLTQAINWLMREEVRFKWGSSEVSWINLTCLKRPIYRHFSPIRWGYTDVDNTSSIFPYFGDASPKTIYHFLGFIGIGSAIKVAGFGIKRYLLKRQNKLFWYESKYL